MSAYSNPLSPGFTKPAFSALKSLVQDQKKEGKQTICTLMIDETDIFYRDEYAEGKFHGHVDLGDDDMPADEEARAAMVLMAVSVNQSWAVPVAYFLINHLSNEDIANIISNCLHRLSEIEVTVIALSCSWFYDVKMLHALGASLDVKDMRPCFPHPANPAQSIHVVLDTPVLLKLLWQTLAEKKVFRTSSGEIKWHYIEELTKLYKSGLPLPDHAGMGRIDRRLMVKMDKFIDQPFSPTAADDLQHCSEELHLPQFQGSEETVQFIRLVNHMANVLSSKNPLGKGSKAPMKGANKEELRAILQSAESCLLGLMDWDGKPLHMGPRGRYIVQLVSCCRSIWNVFEELVNTPGAPCRFLLTYKLNLDAMKEFFFSLREELGGHCDPTAWEFKKYYRSVVRILVGKGESFTGANPYMLHGYKFSMCR